MTTDTYEIELNNCSFYGYHGVFPEEKKLGQRFFVDAVLTIDSLESCKTGDLSSTVHYGVAFGVIEKLVEGPSIDLIETLAYKIGESLCSEFACLLSAKITIRKPSVPISGILDYASVTVSYSRAR